MLLKNASERSIHLTLAFVVGISVFGIDILIPSIPATVDFFGAAKESGQQIVAVYLAGYALGQIPIGLLSDRFGRLPILYSSLAIFVMMSIVAVIASSITMLLWARFFQGVAGAGGPVLARAIARDIASGTKLAKLTALLVSTLAIATLAAPLLGSGLIAIWGWQSPYMALVVLALIAILLLVLFIRESKQANISVSMVDQIKNSSRAFFSSTQSIWGCALVSLTFFSYMAIVAAISQIVVDVYGKSAVAVGLVFSAAICFYVLSAQVGRLALRWVNSWQLIKIGIIGYVLSLALCCAALLIEAPSLWFFWFSLLPFLVGMGLIFSNCTAIALSPLPESAGFAASIMGTSQILLATVGAFLTGFLYERSIDSLMIVMVIGTALALVVFALGLSSKKMITAINQSF